jgi:hypothetical protein
MKSRPPPPLRHEPDPPSSQLGEPVKRITITMLESQHAALVAAGKSVSGTIRELLADSLSRSTLRIHVDAETREIYDALRSGTGLRDELVVELRPVLRRLLDRKLRELEELRRRLR